jgi:tRNA-binding protein
MPGNDHEAGRCEAHIPDKSPPRRKTIHVGFFGKLSKNENHMSQIKWEDFEKIDIRLGTVIEAKPFPNARKPAYQLSIDFGELGIKRSSAQITAHYTTEELEGLQVVAVVNFPPKQIANFFSECLVLGVYDSNHDVVLLKPAHPLPNGSKIG